MKSMFAPAECFKAAIVCPPIAYFAERYVYHHSGHSCMIFALYVAGVAVFFGVIGLLEGFGG